jgi:hypothetical protein
MTSMTVPLLVIGNRPPAKRWYLCCTSCHAPDAQLRLLICHCKDATLVASVLTGWSGLHAVVLLSCPGCINAIYSGVRILCFGAEL